MVDFTKAEFDENLGKWVPATGRPGARIAEFDGEKWTETGANPSPGAISRGLTTGIETAKGILGEALPALFQSALGYDEAAQKNLLQYQERMKKLEESGLGSRVRMGDIEGLGSLLSFAGESLGEAIPSIATALIPGVGLGAAGASTLGRAAVSKAAGKVASTAAETAAKEVARREAAGIAVDASMRAAIEKAALEAAPAAIGRNWGNIAGAALGSAAQNMPETFATIYNETGEMRPEVAGLVGGIKSALDVVTPLQLIKKTRGVDFSERLSDILAGRLLKGRPGAAGAVGGLLESAAFEGLTEGLQETLDQLAVATLADKSVDWSQILEAGLKGTFGGAVPGAAAGYMGGRAKGREAAQLGELKAAQDAEESRQAELQQRYAELGSQPPDYMAGVRSSFVGANPGFRLTPEGEMDRGRMEEEARQRIEAEIPPSQREKALKDYNKYLDKIDLAYQDYVFNATKKREAEVAARQKAQEETTKARAAGEERRAADLEIIQRGNADSSLLRDDAFRQQFDEARQREANRREAAATERRMDQEELASLGFGDFPPQATPLTTAPTPISEATRDTLLDAGYRLDQIAAMGPRAESVAKGVRREAGLYTKEEAPKLQTWVRNEVEDYLGELRSGQRVSLPVVQKRLKDAGYDASKQDVTDILTQYTSGAESLVPVDASLRLGRNPEDPNVFVKQVGAPAVAPRLKVGEDVGGVPPKGGFEGVTLATEVTRPTTPLQATLQNPPAGLTSRQYEALRNRIIRRDPKATLTKKDLDAAAGGGVELTQKQAADIWEALSKNGDVKRQGFGGYRANPEAELSTEYRDEGSPRMDKPKEVKGETLIPKGTRNKLYGLGYTRDDIAGMTTEEAQGIASRREKKSDTREMASSAKTPLTLKEAGFRQDNPALRGNLEWLQEKQALADADYPLTKGMNGSITAEFMNPIELPVSFVSKIPGEMGEKRVPGESQFDTLLKRVKKKGWKPEPIYIDVNHRGEAFIYEGNTRVAVAKELGIDRIPVYVRWINGAELVEGQWSPQNILDIASSKKKTSTREMASDAEMHARNFGGTVAWQEGDLALIKTFSLNGTPIYVPTRGTRFARVNIDMVAPTSTFSAEDIAKLKKIRDRLQAEDKAREAANPQGPFKEGENVVFAGKIKPEIQGILRGWMQMLGLGGQRIVFATPEGAAGMLDLPGKWGRIANLGATLRGQGSSTSLGDGVHVIIIREGMPVVRTLETLAHEMGHILETTALREASPEVRRQIEMEFRNWLATNSPKAARDYMQALRAMRGGRFVDPGSAQTGNDLTFYWKSFGEWFADQVSRWATTQQKPISVVEQFFQRLANVLKNFFTGEKAKFAPNQKVADWLNTLDKVTPPSAGGIAPTREMKNVIEAGKIALGIKPIGRRSLMQGAAAAAGAPDISIAKDVLKQGEVLGEAWVGNGEATGRILGQIFAGKSPLPNLPYEFNLPQGLMEDLHIANETQDVDSDESLRGASGPSLHSIRGHSYDLLDRVNREKDLRKKAALKKKVSDFVYKFDDFEASLGSTAYEKRQAILNKIMEYHNTDMWIGNYPKFKNMDMALLEMLFKEAPANGSAMEAGPRLTAPAYNEDSSKLYRIGFDRFLEAFIDDQPSGNLETNLRKLEASSILNDPQTFYKVAAEKFLIPYYELMDSESYLDRLQYTYIPGKPESLTDFNDLDNNTKKSIINRMNELRKTVHDSTNIVRQLATVNMDDMRQIVENLRRYNKQFAATTSQVIAELEKYDSKVFESPEIKQKLEKFEKELNQISAEVKMEMAAGKPIPRKPGLTILQSGMMQQLESMFPDMGKLNLPKGNKEALEFARRLDADINMQVEMGEPATKPYDCR